MAVTPGDPPGCDAVSCHTHAMDRRQTPRVIAAGAIGNMLEWYDFAIYG